MTPDRQGSKDLTILPMLIQISQGANKPACSVGEEETWMNNGPFGFGE